MVRIVGVIIIVVAVLAAAAAVPAAADVTTRFIGSAGGVIPTNPSSFTDGWNPGFTASLGFGFEFGDKLTAFGALDFAHFDLKEGKINDLIPPNELPPGVSVTGGGDLITIFVWGGARYYPWFDIDAGWKPYVNAGGGYFRAELTDFTFSGNDQNLTTPLPQSAENGFGFSVGAGVEFGRFFAEIDYVLGLLETTNVGYVPIRVVINIIASSQ